MKYYSDYILINKKLRNSIKNVEAYSPFASIGSDHRVISARLKLSLRKVKTPAQKKLYNWSALSNNEKLQHQYTIQIRNRYAELCIEGEDITEKYDPLLGNKQNGFGPKRSTTSYILAFLRIIEAKRNNVPITIVFVDFSEAFDSVHRAKMMRILKAYGIPNELITAIQKLDEETRAKVLSPDGETEYFEILEGVF